MEDPSEYVELDREAAWNLGTLWLVSRNWFWSSWRDYVVLCSVAPRCILCTDGASWYLMAPHGNMLHVPWTPHPVCSWPLASSRTFEAIVLLDQKLASKRLVGELSFQSLIEAVTVGVTSLRCWSPTMTGSTPGGMDTLQKRSDKDWRIRKQYIIVLYCVNGLQQKKEITWHKRYPGEIVQGIYVPNAKTYACTKGNRLTVFCHRSVHRGC